MCRGNKLSNAEALLVGPFLYGYYIKIHVNKLMYPFNCFLLL